MRQVVGNLVESVRRCEREIFLVGLNPGHPMLSIGAFGRKWHWCPKSRRLRCHIAEMFHAMACNSHSACNAVVDQATVRACQQEILKPDEHSDTPCERPYGRGGTKFLWVTGCGLSLKSFFPDS